MGVGIYYFYHGFGLKQDVILEFLLNITFQYKSEVQFLSFVPYKFIVRFPLIFEYGNGANLDLGIIYGNQIDNGLRNRAIISNRWIITVGNWSSYFIFIVLNSRHDGVNINIRHH